MLYILTDVHSFMFLKKTNKKSFSEACGSLCVHQAWLLKSCGFSHMHKPQDKQAQGLYNML